MPRRKKNKGGRPTKITSVVVRKLVEGFKFDFTVEEACRYAGIGKTTFYAECERNPAFQDEMNRAQDWPLILAKKRVVREINLPGGGDLAMKFLERRQRERYSPKLINEHTGSMAVDYRELESPIPNAKTPDEARKTVERS